MKSIKLFCAGLVVALSLFSAGCASMGSQVWIPRESEGQRYNLDATLYLPEGKAGPFPVVIFSHGAIFPGEVDTTSQFGTKLFLTEGFAVLLPMRSGHGASGGRNHEPTSNVIGTFWSGINHAEGDLHAVVKYVKTNPLLDSSRIILSGQSRGGAVSTSYAAKEGDPNIKGVISFSGDWWGPGHRKTSELFQRAGMGHVVPNLWIYGKGDHMVADVGIKNFFEIFTFGGGTADFKYYPHGLGGHFIIQNPSVWEKDVKNFLKKIGF